MDSHCHINGQSPLLHGPAGCSEECEKWRACSAVQDGTSFRTGARRGQDQRPTRQPMRSVPPAERQVTDLSEPQLTDLPGCDILLQLMSSLATLQIIPLS